MNRYVTEGALLDAQAGRRVGFLMEGDLVRHVFPECAGRAVSRFAVDGVVVRRRNGGEQITFPGGGSVKFFRSVKAMRGVRLDVVVVERGGPYDGAEPLFDELASTVGATSDGFELIRA